MPPECLCRRCLTPYTGDGSPGCNCESDVLVVVGTSSERVNHPAHYGGADNPYEVIKVLGAWKLLDNFCLGNAIKYIARAGKKGDTVEDLKKAIWYLEYECQRLTTK